MPVIETLRREQRSEFHLYATQEQVVKGFFFLFYMEFSNTVKPVPTMTFVWVVPKFRRQGLFQQMYSDAIQGHGIIWIDAPNEPCQYALKKAGWTPRALLDQYEKAS